MGRDQRVDQFCHRSARAQRHRAFLVNAREPAIAGHVCREDRRQPPFDPRLGHNDRPPYRDFELSLRSGSEVCLSRQRCPQLGLVSRGTPVQTAMRNCTRDEGWPFEVGNQVLISSHRKLLSSKAMVVNVAEKPKTRFWQA